MSAQPERNMTGPPMPPLGFDFSAERESPELDPFQTVDKLHVALGIWQRAVFTDDPFLEYPIETTPETGQLDIDPSVGFREEEVVRGSDLLSEDLESEISREITREHAPHLATIFNVSNGKLEQLVTTIDTKLTAITINNPIFSFKPEIQIDPVDVLAQQAELKKIAALFPSKGDLSDVQNILDLQRHALAVDTIIEAARSDPKYAERKQAIADDDGLSRTAKSELNQDLVTEMIDGYIVSRGLRKFHRSDKDLVEDHKRLEVSKLDIFGNFRRGNLIFGNIRHAAAQGMVTVALEMAEVLREIKVQNENNFRAAKTSDTSISDEESKSAVQTEEYVKNLAREITLLFNKIKFQGSDEQLSLVRSLNGDTIARAQRLALKAHNAKMRSIGTVSVSAEVVEDPDFRRTFTAASKIAGGGNRIDDARAPQLAKELHKTRFGTNGDNPLKPHESGILVAIFTEKLDPLLQTIDRLKLPGANSDQQLRFARGERAQQYLAIQGVNIEATIIKLRELLMDPMDQNMLLNPLLKSGLNPKDQHIQRAIDKLTGLIKKYCPEHLDDAKE